MVTLQFTVFLLCNFLNVMCILLTVTILLDILLFIKLGRPSCLLVLFVFLELKKKNVLPPGYILLYIDTIH